MKGGTGEKRMNKKNIWVIVGVLVASCVLLAFSRLSMNGKATGEVRVYLDGALYATGTLGKNETIVVHGADDAENIVEITEDGVHMQYSSCHNQQCIEQGTVTMDNYKSRALGTRIICLPNRVVVELVLDNENADDDLPDV